MRNMGKIVCTPTTCQPHPCVCEPNQINTLTSTNQCRENVQLLPMHANGHITPLKQTDNRVSSVSLLRASTLPENSFSDRYLNVGCAQHGQTCVYANNMPAKSLCLRSRPSKCTRFNQPMHRERSVASYAYEQYTRKPSSDLQPC